MSMSIAVLRRVAAAALCAALLSPSPTQAKPIAKPRPERQPVREARHVSTGLENLERQVHDFTLPNGYTFIVVERHEAPVFSYATVVNAGSANDMPGTTGLAHMMEHMAFKGTTIIGTTDYAKEKPLLDAEEQAWQNLLAERRKGAAADTVKIHGLEKVFADAQLASHGYVNSNEYSRILEAAGARDMNAYTANDITVYFFSIPSNRLDLWALTEGAKFAHPVFREFYKERDVVYEERRMRTESSPVGRLIDEFTHAAFVAHPYGYGGIGFPSDLRQFSRTQGEEYFRRYYVAKNIVTAVVGDVSTPQVQQVAQKYFGDLSDAPPPPPIATIEPEQHAERRVTLEDQAQPVFIVGWHIPAASDPSYGAYKAVADLLGGGDYARLQKKLVKEDKIATQVEGFTDFPGEKYPHLMGFFVVPASGQSPEKVEQAVYDVIEDVATKHPITAEELNGYKVRVKSQKIAASEKNDNLASELAQAQTLYGDWHQFFREQERVQSLTVRDVMDVMKSTLTRTNRTVGMMENPKPAETAEGGR